MSKVGYKWNAFRVFEVTYTVFGKKGRAVSYKQHVSAAIKDIRNRNNWSQHNSFEIIKVECKEFRNK